MVPFTELGVFSDRQLKKKVEKSRPAIEGGFSCGV